MANSKSGVVTAVYGNQASVRVAGSPRVLKGVPLVGDPSLVSAGSVVQLSGTLTCISCQSSAI